MKQSASLLTAPPSEAGSRPMSFAYFLKTRWLHPIPPTGQKTPAFQEKRPPQNAKSRRRTAIRGELPAMRQFGRNKCQVTFSKRFGHVSRYSVPFSFDDKRKFPCGLTVKPYLLLRFQYYVVEMQCSFHDGKYMTIICKHRTILQELFLLLLHRTNQS